MSDEIKSNSEIYAKIFFLALGVSLAILGALLAISLGAKIIVTDDKHDILNWVSLVIEFGLATFITFAIMIYSNRDEKRRDLLLKKVSDIMENTNSIINKQNQTNEQRKKFAIQRLRFESSSLETWVQSIVQISADYWHMALDKNGADNTQKEIGFNAIFEGMISKEISHFTI